MNKASSSESKRGCILRGLPYFIVNHNPISIGSDRGCDIVIEGADCHHAELRWDDEDDAWSLYDDPAPGETLVNGESIVKMRLHENDWFEVSGVRIRFADEKLSELDLDSPVGLRVTLRGVSAVAGGELRLDNISFQAAEGSFVALLGPSGCGKSTLIQRIAGFSSFKGEIRFNGHDLRAEKDGLLPLIAYLPQAVEDTLHGEMTVSEAMKDFVRCHLAADANPDFAKKLEEVGLAYNDEFAKKEVRLLSGGQKRRLALALALMRDPQLLLLDEPTAGLDPSAEAGIMELLRRIADQGRTVLCATHVLGRLGLCDKVLLLGPGGQSVFFGKPAEALQKYGAQDWLSIYQALASGNISAETNSAPEDPSPRPLPPPVTSASFCGVFRGTFSRLFRCVQRKWNAVLFFGSPIIIAAVLVLACKSMFKEGGSIGTACFCMVVAMFWLGLSGAVGSLVSERVPKRCLDRMRGMSLPRYFAAHVAFVAFSAIVQSFLFVGFVFLICHHPKLLAPDAFATFWLVLALIDFAGACVGLMVSAIWKKEILAVWSLPFIAILALFLSKPVLETGDEKPKHLLRAIEYAMPTLCPQTLLETELKQYRVQNPDGEAHLRNKWNFAWLAIGYPLVFLPLAYFLQKRREEEWDGRC